MGMGTPIPPPEQEGAAPKFSAHVYCGQTAGWMKLVLGMDVGLSPGDFVLDGDLAPSPKRGQSPLCNFRPISIVAKRLDASRCYLKLDVGLSPGDFVLDGDPVPSPQKGNGAP